MGAASSAGRSVRTSVSLASRFGLLDTNAVQGIYPARISGKHSTLLEGKHSTILEGLRRMCGQNVMHYSTSGSNTPNHQQQHAPPPGPQHPQHGPQVPVPAQQQHTPPVPQQTQLPVPPARPCKVLFRPMYNFPVSNAAKFEKVNGVEFGMSTRTSDLYLKFDPIKFARINPMMRQYQVHGSKVNGKLLKIWVVEDFAKILERDLILLIITQHSLNRCFANLTVNDFYICADGTFSLREGVAFEERTPKGINRDFANAADLLESLLTECPKRIGGEVPADHQHLLGLMRAPISDRGYLIATHAAMLTMSTRSIALRKLHGEVMELIPHGILRDQILKKITINGSNWKAAADSNIHLKACVSFRNSRSNTVHYDFESAGDLLDLNRNFDAHKYQHCSKLAEGQSELIQYSAFPLLLPELQEALWDEFRIRHLHIEELFTDGKSAILHGNT